MESVKVAKLLFSGTLLRNIAIHVLKELTTWLINKDVANALQTFHYGMENIV